MEVIIHMKKIDLNKKINYSFVVIEPADIEGVNIGGILAIPNGELKTNKLMLILQEDKYKSKIKDDKIGEEKSVKTIEDSAKRIISQGNIENIFNGFGFDGQVILMPMLPNDKRISETISDKEHRFGAEFLSRECFTDIPENNPYYRLDEQINKM